VRRRFDLAALESRAAVVGSGPSWDGRP
jgi:hypothetical protein